MRRRDNHNKINISSNGLQYAIIEAIRISLITSKEACSLYDRDSLILSENNPITNDNPIKTRITLI
ncbi:hypothetical protein KC711_07990 [Candidatus Peregrinibacteria bacterium]|nr:hypothetical protein [Candidatus Peregrinibacteria bacterium]